jgi:hypothetical protein
VPIEDDAQPSLRGQLIRGRRLLSLQRWPHTPNPTWCKVSACPFGTPREEADTGLLAVVLGSRNGRILIGRAGVAEKMIQPKNRYWGRYGRSGGDT